MTTLSFAVESGNKAGKKAELDSSWRCTEWKLSQLRGGAGETVERSVGEEEVLEFELEDGSVVFLAPDQLGEYGFQPSRAGGAIEIGAALSVPGADSRDGGIAWSIRSLRLWRNPAGAAMHALAGTLQDLSLGQRLGWHRFGDQAVPVEALQAVPPSKDPVLLMIHGTISSTPGSFGGLLQGQPLEQLRKLYVDRLYGFEHRTLTDSPLENALELAKGLPENLTADVITHSRGGLVAELLIRAAERGDGGLKDAEIELFKKSLDAKVRDAFARGLEELRELVQRKNLIIRRIVRTAAPMRGTTLLSGRLDRWSSVVFNLISKGFDLAGRVDAAKVVQAAKALMLELTRQREDADVLPGLEAMRPESPWVSLLNPPERKVTVQTFVIAGDYQGKSLLSWLTDRFSESFYGGANDFVVNTASMSGGAHRHEGLRYALFRDRDTHHLSYFKREPVQRRILEALERGAAAAGFETIQRETEWIARGGRKTKAKPNAPIALLLPGITGSHLEVGRDRIWMQPHELLFGNIRKLRIDAEEVRADGWIDRYYERFSDFLTATHEVRPFAYDWRRSIADTGAEFAKALAEALDEAEKRKQPVHIFAHSMGGLVARWALGPEGLWSRLEKLTGSRLVMLGTPNRGSHSIPWLLMGREKTLRLIDKVDRRHDARELVDLFRQFPGVLQLMPYEGGSGGDFFRIGYWKEALGALGQQWPIPDAKALEDSRDVLKQLNDESLEGKPVIYVAGHEPKDQTISGVNLAPQLTPSLDPRGDGRVLWTTGIPDHVSAWYAKAAHGDLPRFSKAFEGYRELAVHGSTASRHLSKDVPISATAPSPSRGARPAIEGAHEALVLYPTPEELLAAAMGGRPDELVDSAPTAYPVRIALVHGNISTAHGAVVVGHCEDDEQLSGAARSLDCLIGGGLSDALAMDCLPGRSGEVLVVPGNPRAGQLDAIVIGLGRVGTLDLGTLQQGFAKALREYALKSRWEGDSFISSSIDDQAPDPHILSIDVATVLVGSGTFGLTIDAVISALAMAAVDVQASLLALPARGGRKVLISTLRIFELDLARAERAALVLDRLGNERAGGQFEFDGKVHPGEHGLQTYLTDATPANDALRVHITAQRGLERGLDFTVISNSARSEFIREPQQGQFVHHMLDLATGSTADQVGLSRALFELLTPNSYKPLIGNLQSLVLNVDETAAAIPWEWMRDGDPKSRPLATRLRMVRQLVRSPKESAPRAKLSSALVIGDTNTGDPKYPTLTGARREMQIVRARLRVHLDDVEGVEGIAGLDMLKHLLTREIGLLHIAAHGDWVELPGGPDECGGKTFYSGVVLDKGLLLTSHQIAKLPRVPEFVFLNCCHLGDSRREGSRERWSELAASLAIAFIDRGAKAVVACGWAVNDAAAAQFADTLYDSLLRGSDLASAALSARRATYEGFPAHNTWGAYQVYGDPNYQLGIESTQTRVGNAERKRIFTRLTALDAIQRLIGWHQVEERCLASDTVADPGKHARAETEEQLEHLIESLHHELMEDAEVRAAIARAYQVTGNRPKAIEHWRAALACKVAAVPLRDIEQLANAETRQAAAMLHSTLGRASTKSLDSDMDLPEAIKQSEVLLAAGLERISSLIQASGGTMERLCVKASAQKRDAWISALTSQSGNVSSDRPLERLRASIKTYEDAAAQAATPADEKDHYPANNMAQLRWLEALLLNRVNSALLAEVRETADAARRNAARRAQAGGDFWVHAASVDSALAKALADASVEHTLKPGESAAIAQRLIAAIDTSREQIQRRFGDSYKNASPREQLQFFSAMLGWRAQSGAPHATSLREWKLAFDALLVAFSQAPRQHSAPSHHSAAAQSDEADKADLVSKRASTQTVARKRSAKKAASTSTAPKVQRTPAKGKSIPANAAVARRSTAKGKGKGD